MSHRKAFIVSAFCSKNTKMIVWRTQHQNECEATNTLLLTVLSSVCLKSRDNSKNNCTRHLYYHYLLLEEY